MFLKNFKIVLRQLKKTPLDLYIMVMSELDKCLSLLNRLELCLDHFLHWLCWPEVINKDPTVWLIGARPTLSTFSKITWVQRTLKFNQLRPHRNSYQEQSRSLPLCRRQTLVTMSWKTVFLCHWWWNKVSWRVLLTTIFQASLTFVSRAGA
jgi:hypothetical protein